MTHIREAQKEDLPAVLNLIKELALFEKQPQEVEVTLQTLEKAGFGEHKQYICFVAEANNTIVGMALIYFRFSTWKGTTVHLEDLIVTQKYRGKGVGALLYNKVLKYAYQKKVKRVQWEVLNWNVEAINFYEKTGAFIKKDWQLVEMNEQALNNYLKNESI